MESSDAYRKVVRELRHQNEARRFDPYRIPDQFICWMVNEPNEDVRDHHAGELAKRFVAADFIQKAVAALMAALAKVPDPRLEQSIESLSELASDIHDYDPTSD